MTIPTQMSLTGFIATAPQLTFGQNGVARLHTRVGVDQFRQEPDGGWTKLDPTFHDLVLFHTRAERAYGRFHVGDQIIASGYVHEFERTRNGATEIREQFVAKRMGHDPDRTKYEVHRRQPDQTPEPPRPEPTPPSPTLHAV